jgi:leucyl aminopeptidase (aminopeptidase T)
LRDLLKETARSIVARCACLKKGFNVVVICGRHNRAFAEDLMLECYREHAYPYLWMFDEDLLKKARKAAKDAETKLPRHACSLLENSDLTIWLTQFENPKSAPAELGPGVCSYWDQVYEIVKGKPLLSVNLLSKECLETMKINYGKFLVTFANAVNVDYDKVKQVGSAILERLHKKELIKITTPDGTDLTFSIKGRRIGVETGTLKECFSTGKECEVEIPAGEVYVAPIESSAHGTLVTDEVRDFGVQKLRMEFHEGRITSFEAVKGKASFKRLLAEAQGQKDRIAELGIGINYGMTPIGLRIYDEKALGTAHIAIGNNTHLGGTNEASIHIDFILHKPTIKADKDVIMKDGKVA